MGVMTSCFNSNISPKGHMVCLSVILLFMESQAYYSVIKDLVMKKGALFVPDPVFRCNAVHSQLGILEFFHFFFF